MDIQAPASGGADVAGAAGAGSLGSGIGSGSGPGLQLTLPTGGGGFGAGASHGVMPGVGRGGAGPASAQPAAPASIPAGSAGTAPSVAADGGPGTSPYATHRGPASGSGISARSAPSRAGGGPSAPVSAVQSAPQRGAAAAATGSSPVGRVGAEGVADSPELSAPREPPATPEGRPIGRVGLEIREMGLRVHEARLAEAAGDPAAVESSLARFFEDQARRSSLEASPRGAASTAADGAAGSGGRRILSGADADAGASPDRRIGKVAALASAADPADAPMLFRQALGLVFSRFASAEARRRSMGIFHAAARRAPRAVRDVARRALADAASGALTGRGRRKDFDALDFWNAHLVLSGAPSVRNLPQLKSVIRRIAEAAAGGTRFHGAPGVRFIETPPDGRGPSGLRAAVRLPEGAEGAAAVRELKPADLAFDLAPSALAALELEDSPLAAGFGLEPDGRDGFRAVYAERRAEGDSILASAWIALGRWARAQADGFWARLVRLVRRLLGRPEPASAREAGFRVSTDDADVAALRAELRRGGETARLPLDSRHAAARARFDAFSEVLGEAETALAALQGAGARPTFASARSARDAIAEAASAYARWTGDAGPAAAIGKIWRELEGRSAAAGGDAPLSEGAARLVDAEDAPSLLRAAALLRDAALEAVGRGAPASPANALARSMGPDGGPREAAFLDLSPSRQGTDSQAGRAFLRALAASLPGDDGGSVVLRDSMFWARYPSKQGAAEILADVRPPESGGMIRVRYEQSQPGLEGRARLYLAARYFFELGFAVRLDNGGVYAVVDKDGEAHAADRLADDLTRAIRLFASGARLEAAASRALAGAVGPQERARRIDGLVRALLSGRSAGRDESPEGPLSVAARVVLSRGDGRPVEGIATYDRSKAARGGYVFITPFVDDPAAVVGSKAVLATSAGPSSRTALLARRAGVPAVRLEGAWTRASGFDVRAGGRAFILREGALVRLDPADGAVEILRHPTSAPPPAPRPIPPR